MAVETNPRAIPAYIAPRPAGPPPAAIDPDTLPATFHARTHALTAIWFALAAVCAATLHAIPSATLWLWMNPVCVVLLLFTLSMLAMQTLPRLPKWPPGFVAAMTGVQALVLGAATECVFIRYINAPSSPLFLAAAAQLVVLALLGDRLGAGTTGTEKRVLAVAGSAGLVATLAAITIWHRHRPLLLAIPLANLATAALVTIDHARSRALARIARDRHPDLAAIRTAALLVFDVIYLFVLVPRALLRRR